MTKSHLAQLTEDPREMRLFQQERLAVEITELMCKTMKERGVKRSRARRIAAQEQGANQPDSQRRNQFDDSHRGGHLHRAREDADGLRRGSLRQERMPGAGGGRDEGRGQPVRTAGGTSHDAAVARRRGLRGFSRGAPVPSHGQPFAASQLVGWDAAGKRWHTPRGYHSRSGKEVPHAIQPARRWRSGGGGAAERFSGGRAATASPAPSGTCCTRNRGQ